MDRRYPNVGQANLFYLLMVLCMILGSVLIRFIGVGGNLWVNELVYLLAPAYLLSRKYNWSWKEVYRFKKVDRRLKIAAVIGGIGFWLFAGFFSIMVERFLSNQVGNVTAGQEALAAGLSSPLQTILFIIGMVILAPFCEEVFFRGFIQRAYSSYSKKRGWLIVGLLFGALHLSNGISNFSSVIILGLILSYLMYVTDSIWPPILWHGVNNLMALFGGGLLQKYTATKTVPLNLILLALLGAVIGIGAIKYIKDNAKREEVEGNRDNVKFKKAVALAIALVLLIFTGGMDLVMRAGLINLEDNLSKTSMKIGRFEKSMTVGKVEVEEPSTMVLKYKLNADKADFVMKITGPDGQTVWEKEHRDSNVAGNWTHEIELDQSGEWKIEMIGSGKEMELDSSWHIKN